MMPIIPSSNPAPFTTSRSAFSIDSACRADGEKSCGSDPTGMITSTAARSPTAWVTMSPRMFVVTTIVGSSASVSGAAVSGAAVPGAAVSVGADVSVVACVVWAGDPDSSVPQATATTPSEQTATTRLRVRIFLMKLSYADLDTNDNSS
jgi:hypothetical protein